MKNTNGKKPLLRVPYDYLEIITKTDECLVYLTSAEFQFAATGSADFNIRYSTLEVAEKMETQIDRNAAFYCEKELGRYKIITETFGVSMWETETVLVTDNEGNSCPLSSRQPLSVSYSPSIETTWSDDENQISMQAYRYLEKQLNRIIGTWQFSSPEYSARLELGEDGGVRYYRRINGPQNSEAGNENRLKGSYHFRLDAPGNYAFKIVYDEAEYSPYDSVNGLPTSYAVADSKIKAEMNIELQDANTIKVFFGCCKSNSGGGWKNEALVLKRIQY